jgi:uncharacterized membrane-anchored protein
MDAVTNQYNLSYSITVIMNGCFIYFIPNLKLLGLLVQSRDFHLAFIFFRDFHLSFILHGFL